MKFLYEYMLVGVGMDLWEDILILSLTSALDVMVFGPPLLHIIPSSMLA